MGLGNAGDFECDRAGDALRPALAGAVCVNYPSPVCTKGAGVVVGVGTAVSDMDTAVAAADDRFCKGEAGTVVVCGSMKRWTRVVLRKWCWVAQWVCVTCVIMLGGL